ncbi:glycosyltransferase family 4 protein [Pseudomonas asiatica]|uniref:glycosyltransferase family 4 protein n=1 Tax=Pseudomonas asiatica TaxID=2219225 RepID=UPI0015F98945|nr:glycosyltransferase family 4 protein [Pseudomonas asiatica]MBA6109357.1 glycosyltransferase family 4 protein [Pseudomonas asiatica]
MKICHLTSVHPRYDTRIFYKECVSLANANNDVMLVVADGLGDEQKNGVSILDVGKLPGRLNRILKTTRRVLAKAVVLDADIYHIHDPELLPAGVKLRSMGRRVIFDAHEDVPKQILGKPYLNRFTKLFLSVVLKAYEGWACSRMSGVIAATPYIRDKFSKINAKVVDINNFPMVDELAVGEIDWSKKKDQVCYVGGIAEIRGISEIVQAMESVEGNTRLLLGGTFTSEEFERKVSGCSGWKRTDAPGFLSRDQVKDALYRSRAGLVTLHPAINYLDALPVKMFEYMAAGIPVIASNFPLWEEIISRADCGICVDPLKPSEIALAISQLAGDSERAAQMGLNGRKAVFDKYNWGVEEQKLLSFYAAL